MKKNFLFFGLFLLASLGMRAQVNQEALKVTYFKLDNGLSVYLNEDHSRTEVLGGIAVKAGSKYDPSDATGMAHYLEHMCFKGTQTMGTTDFAKEKPILDTIVMLYDQLAQTKEEPKRKEIQKKINEASVRAAAYAIPNEMDRMLQSIGGKGLNAFTSNEMIVYHNSFPGHQVEKWLDIYSERFTNPVFRLFQSELEVVYEEKNRGTDNFFVPLFETFMENLYRKHPYGTNSTIGKTEHLKNPPLRRMQEYYNTYFVANNMALVMSGDFNTAEVIPMIKAKFGKWRTGTVPNFPEYKEEPFKGKEIVSKRLSPVKIGIMGFRTVPETSPDKYCLEICNYILSNEGSTGLLDQLRMDGKLQYAGAMAMLQKDLGSNMVIFLPKIIGQSFGNAEKEVFGALGKLRDNAYDDALFQAAKNNLRKEFYQKLEDPQQRAFFIANAFIMGQSWEEILSYPDKIAAISKEDVQRIAKQYFGENCLVFESKMGFPKKDKLEKPGFAPVKPKEGVKSAYAQQFEKLPSGKPVDRFVDFQKDVYQSKLAHNEKLFVTANPMNSIFDAKLIYHVSNLMLPGVEDASSYLGYIGADTLTDKAFRMKMNALGCTYSFEYTKKGVEVNLSGLEENVKEAVRLLNLLMMKPKPDEAKYKQMVSDIKTNRKLEKGDPQALGEVLSAYLQYGANSSYLKRASLKSLSAGKPENMLAIVPKMMMYPVSIHYSGRKPSEEIRQIFTEYAFSTSAPDREGASARNVPLSQRSTYAEPTIYLLSRKDARQSQVYFYGNLPQVPVEQRPYMGAFNSYFGADMSALVFQEIRELRSLAYSCYAIVDNPDFAEETPFLRGYIGCQGDKTKEALSTMFDLLKKMPEKTERIDAVRSGLTERAYTNRPFFRDMSERMEQWQQQGYTTDPNKLFLPSYEKLTFDQMLSFYKQDVQNLPVSIAIVGNEKNISVDELKKYGKVVKVDLDQIRTE